MFFYVTYGLKISSELLLPELVPIENVEVRADVTIRLGKLTSPRLEATKTNCCCYITPEEAYLSWQEGGTFLVRGGREIIIDPIAHAEERILRLYLLGAVLGILLHQRGLLVLHASTVAVNGSALAFIGDSGWGKSTTAGALHARGHRLVSDDVTAIALNSSPIPIVIPGYGRLKLWPDAAKALGASPENLPRLHPEFEKRDRAIAKGFSPTPLPLKGIYLLGGGSILEIKQLSVHEALAAVMRNWYCSRFGRQMLQATGISAHFLQCTSLVNCVSIYHLKRQPDLGALNDIAQLVEQHSAYKMQQVQV
jgi:hypothetical protein